MLRLIGSGNAELDNVLGGGLPANRVYLLHGSPGAGKTTLAMQFLLEGVRNGETVMYITLSETRVELETTAASHGWVLDGVNIFELIAQENELAPENQYTMFQPAEVELSVTTKIMIDEIERLKPMRVIIDSLSEVKLLAQSIPALPTSGLSPEEFFMGRQCTTIFLDDKTATADEDKQLESIAHGVISLEQLSPEYGAERRRLRITKLRGQKYRGGYHDFAITTGGLTIFPRLVASEHTKSYDRTTLKTDIMALDTMLGGGIEYGSRHAVAGSGRIGQIITRPAIRLCQRPQRRARCHLFF